MITGVFVSENREVLRIEFDDGEGLYELPAGALDLIEVEDVPRDGWIALEWPCICLPGDCRGEADIPCQHCAQLDGELPCPIADA